MATYIWKAPSALVHGEKIIVPEQEFEIDSKHAQVAAWLKLGLCVEAPATKRTTNTNTNKE